MSLRCGELSDHVFDQINSILTTEKSNQILIGYSGGLDSTVLTHIIVGLKDKFRSTSVLAVHFNHGVNQTAKQWADHCQLFCNAHNLELKTLNFSLADVKSNREAEYRNARYEAFANELAENGLLLTAHHQRDQAETVLFNLFRGAGVSGLRGMKLLREFGRGFHLRPLLSIPHQRLIEYSQRHNLLCIDDPSNHDQDFDRNYIRHELLPIIEKRWPAAQTSIMRSTDLLNQTEEILAEVAELDITQAHAANFPGEIKNQYFSVLNKKRLGSLSMNRQRNAVKHWLQHNISINLNFSQINQIILDLCAINKRSGLFEIEGYQIRAYKNFIYLMPKLGLAINTLSQPQKINNRTYLFEDLNLQLCFERTMPDNLQFRLREHAKRVQVHGQTKNLKKLYQDCRIPPWERKVLPLIYLNNQFITIAGTAINPDYRASVALIDR